MALLTDSEIREAMQKGEILIDPLDAESLQGSSHDMKLGKRAIIARSVTLEELRNRVQREEVKEINVEKEESMTVPGGAFALVATLERIKLDSRHAGHIGMKTYYIRKGLAILSGLQIDPGWDGVLILGLVNLSPRAITLDYGDHICTVEIHRLNREAGKVYSGTYMAEQREGRIPTADKDYLRTIETMTVSDLTKALTDLARTVDTLGERMRYFWYGIGFMIFMAILTFMYQVLR